MRSESPEMFPAANASIGSSSRCSAISFLLWIDFSEFLLICLWEICIHIFSSLQTYLNPTEQMLACCSCSCLLASIFHGVACENSASNLWQWIIFYLLVMHCACQFNIPVWFLDVTFVLLLPAAAPAMRLISAGPVGCGKCDWATAWAGFMFPCVSERCQKQDPELCWPSLKDYLILLVVNTA